MHTRAKPRKPGTPPSLTVKTVSLRPLRPTRPRVLLGLLCMAQFVLVLDIAVVAVATPSIQADLEVAPTDPQAGEFIADAAVQAGTYRKQDTRWVAACGGETEVCELVGAELGERRPDDRATHRNDYRGGAALGHPHHRLPARPRGLRRRSRRAWADGRGGALSDHGISHSIYLRDRIDDLRRLNMT